MLIVPLWYLFRTLLVPKVALGSYMLFWSRQRPATDWQTISSYFSLGNGRYLTGRLCIASHFCLGNGRQLIGTPSHFSLDNGRYLTGRLCIVSHFSLGNG